MKIGLRTIKTGIAVSLSMLLAKVFDIEYPFFAIVAALIAIQPTVSDSWRVGANRILGTLIGAIVGVLFISAFPANFIFLGIGIIILIMIMNRLGWNEAINIAAVVLVAIFLNAGGDNINYALHRIFDTFLGISIAVAVNYLVYPPTYDKKILTNIKDVSSSILTINLDIINLITENEGISAELLEEKLSLDKVEETLVEAEKYIKLQVKEERIKVYGNMKAKELLIIIGLVKETYQHIQNIIGVLMKGISQEVTGIVIEDLEAIKKQLKEITEIKEGIFSNDEYLDFISIMDNLKDAKKKIKFNEEINKYPTEEVVKMLVYIYNLEESFAKFNVIANLYL